MGGSKRDHREDEEEIERLFEELEEEELSPEGIERQNQSLVERQRRYRLAADVATEALIPFEEVRAVALFGSVARPLWKELPRFRTYRRAHIALWHECRDVDLAVWVSRTEKLQALRRAINKALPLVHKRTGYGVAPHELDVFIMDHTSGRYLGRLSGKPPFLEQHVGFAFQPDALAPSRAVWLFDRAAGERQQASEVPVQFAESRPSAEIPPPQPAVSAARRVPTLRGQHVLLRAPRLSDIDDRLALGRQPEIVRMFGGEWRDNAPLRHEEAVAWLDRLGVHPHAWVIESDRQLVGEIRLDDLNERDRRASLAVGILDPARHGHGLGTEAVELVLGYAFDRLKLQRVSARVLAYNQRTIRCYEKCGFMLEGRERQAARVEGEWHDDLIMGILESEWRGRQEPADAI